MKQCHWLGRMTFGLAASLLLANLTQAHVNLNAPNGNEQMYVGSQFTINWHIVISHTLLNWDLSYSTEGPNGPFVMIVENLPPGSGAVGSIHTYDWTVPNIPDDTMWILVKMDNLGTDYYDVNDLPFSIVLPPTSGTIGQSLQLNKQGTDVEFTWGASCSENDTDYSLYQGTLGDFQSHERVVCTTQGSTTYGPYDAGAGNYYFLVVPRLATHEGSYGSSQGHPRSPAEVPCRAQGSPACL